MRNAERVTRLNTSDVFKLKKKDKVYSSLECMCGLFVGNTFKAKLLQCLSHLFPVIT